MEKTREKILAIIKETPEITIKELAELTELTVKGIEWNIQQLKKNRLLERIGSTKDGYWKIKIVEKGISEKLKKKDLASNMRATQKLPENDTETTRNYQKLPEAMKATLRRKFLICLKRTAQFRVPIWLKILVFPVIW